MFMLICFLLQTLWQLSSPFVWNVVWSNSLLKNLQVSATWVSHCKQMLPNSPFYSLQSFCFSKHDRVIQKDFNYYTLFVRKWNNQKLFLFLLQTKRAKILYIANHLHKLFQMPKNHVFLYFCTCNCFCFACIYNLERKRHCNADQAEIVFDEMLT